MVLPSTVGPLELALIFLILLIIFGPKRLVEIARNLGAAIREFREGLEGPPPSRREREERRAEK
jgi:sec-independent protein translocase protein TatA